MIETTNEPRSHYSHVRLGPSEVDALDYTGDRLGGTDAAVSRFALLYLQNDLKALDAVMLDPASTPVQRAEAAETINAVEKAFARVSTSDARSRRARRKA